jgi:thiol:disulfide interchange protein DsbA
MIRFLSSLLLGLCLAASVQADSNAPRYQEGRDYQVVPNPQPPDDPSVIKVEEFFWYGCPHCYRFEPELAKWRKTLPKDVKFVRVPNNLGHPAGVVHEQAFYIAKLLGIEDQVHQQIMDALVRDRKPLNTLPEMRQFFINDLHVKPEDFDGANGFMVDADVRRADQEAMDYQIQSVPTIVVGGKYLTDAGQPGISDAGTSEEQLYGKVLKVTDFLIDKVRKERQGATKG